MTMVTSHILKFVDFTKTRKSRYLEKETFFVQIEKFMNYISRATLWQKKKTFCSGGNLQIKFYCC